MRVGVGYSDNPVTADAGREAARQAMRLAGREDACDFALLFSTARHAPDVLREAVTSVLGSGVPVAGGGAVGAIANDRFGYAGDQMILAAFWTETTRCDILFEEGLREGEEAVGFRLGRRLAAHGAKPASPTLLFYDAIDRTNDGMRLLMATPLLAGIEKGLGYFPDLVGAGLQGDYTCTPTLQWTGSGTAQHAALALLFSEELRIDSDIMHGCRPATGYYTVTKTDRQTVLEINGEPALPFIERVLGGTIPAESFPFFLILGVNRGDKWAAFDEQSYANRLCLDIDKARGGIVMFEPDMVAGTEFQIMYRSLEHDYMEPKIENLFARLNGRRPVFALYIDCAGRAAGYGGIDMEDAVTVQRTVAGRVPLLGIYTGVEIAAVEGRPRGLDWTGVFSLFSVPS